MRRIPLFGSVGKHFQACDASGGHLSRTTGSLWRFRAVVRGEAGRHGADRRADEERPRGDPGDSQEPVGGRELTEDEPECDDGAKCVGMEPVVEALHPRGDPLLRPVSGDPACSSSHRIYQ